MSETPTGDQEKSVVPTFVDYPQLLTDQELMAPVDLESGRQAVTEVRTTLENFRQQILPELGLGDRTRSVLDQKIQDGLLGKDGLFITNEDYAQFGWEELPDKQDNIAIGQPVVEEHQHWVDQAAQNTQVALSPEQTKDLAYKWVVWHELGHAIQVSYQAAADDDMPTSLSRALLETDIAPMVVEQPMSPPQRLGNFRRVVEGFPEGFAQMLIERYVIDEFGMDAEQAAVLRENLTPPDRREAAANSTRFLQSANIAAASADAVFMRGAYEAGENVGYGNPFTPDQVRAALAYTP